MYWTNAARHQMSDTIRQMGLLACPICGADSLGVDTRPVLLPIGGAPWRPEGEPRRGDVFFMVSVRCEMCAYSMLFDSEKFGPDELIPLWYGPGPPPD